MSIRQHGGRAALLCGLLLLLTGGAAVSAATTDSPVVITGVVPDGDRLEVTLFNGAPCAESIGEWQLSTGSTRTALPKGLILGGFARVTVPVHLPPDGKVEILRLSMPDGKDVQVLEDPVHTWMPGDIFSLHESTGTVILSSIRRSRTTSGSTDVTRSTRRRMVAGSSRSSSMARRSSARPLWREKGPASSVP